MRLPRLSLPRPRLSLDWIGAVADRTTLLYIGYTSALFIVFLIVTFPHEMLIRRALSTVNRGPVGVQFSSANFAWWHGYELSGMRVASADEDGKPPYVEFSHLWVRPTLGALLRGNPYALTLSADLYGGSANGDMNLTDGNFVGVLQLQDLNLGRYRTLTALIDEGQVSGKMSGQLNFEVHGANFNTGQLTGDLTLEGAALTAAKVNGFGIPDVHLRQIKSKFIVRGGRLEIQEFNATGDVNVQGSGQVVLRDPPGESTLNLRATFLPTPQTSDALKGALMLIPRPPGTKPDAPVTIIGTPLRPKFR